MDKEQWEKVNRIVDKALDLPEEQQESFINKQCGNDKELKTQATELFQSIKQSGTENFLENPDDFPDTLAADIATGIEDTDDNSSLVGQTIGSYKIKKLIEHGGMGSVFKAHRADEAYKEPVALKVLRRGMDTPSNVARFKRERNILAKLDHPNIARLLDGGMTDEGLPYLVMEYVEGISLIEYCNKHQLTVSERVNLFESICTAVQHAHQNAVIHRDLKPSNILVTKDGTVKVLDFGIAKLFETEDSESHQSITQTKTRIVTLGYAAPEQLNNQPVTTASDTYALGILFYELLGGVHPFEPKDKSATEIETAILESTPGKPSQKLSRLPGNKQLQIATRYGSSPQELKKILHGDLDAIIMKALRKEPETRYNSAKQLFDDLQRRKKNLPIIARKDTFRYKSTKFLKRYKRSLSIAAGFIILIISFISFYTWQITEERNRAQQEAQKATQISDFLVEIFQASNPRVVEGDTLTAKKLLDRGIKKVNSLSDEIVKSEMLIVLGQTYSGIGEYTVAKQLFERALQLNKNEEKNDQRLLYANALYHLGLLENERHSFEEAISPLRKAFTIQSKLLENNNTKIIQTLADLGFALRNTGKIDSAEYYVKRAMELQKKSAEPQPKLMLQTKATLAYIFRKKEEYAKAESLYKEVISAFQKEYNEDKSPLVSYYNDLAYLYRMKEDYQKAKKYYFKALQLSGKIRPDSHPITNMIRRNYASALALNDKLAEAEYYFKENAKYTQQQFTKNHWRTGSALNTVGYFLLTEQNNPKEAEDYIRRGVNIYQRQLGAKHTWTAYGKGLLCAAEYLQGDEATADSLFNIHYNIYKKNADSLSRSDEGSIKRLIRIYTPDQDTLNNRYVTSYLHLL